MTALAGRFRTPISTPGRRLLRFLPLRFLRSRQAGRGRPLEFELPLVSFVDCLLCLVLFLLASFGARAECEERQRVPSAHNVAAALEAPMVAITQGRISLDGVLAADTREVVGSGRLQRLDELFAQLKSKRELWRQLHPSEEFPGVVVLQIDRRVPALVVKSAFQTAAFAGYPNVSFLVRQR